MYLLLLIFIYLVVIIFIAIICYFLFIYHMFFICCVLFILLFNIILLYLTYSLKIWAKFVVSFLNKWRLSDVMSRRFRFKTALKRLQYLQFLTFARPGLFYNADGRGRVIRSPANSHLWHLKTRNLQDVWTPRSSWRCANFVALD